MRLRSLSKYLVLAISLTLLACTPKDTKVPVPSLNHQRVVDEAQIFSPDEKQFLTNKLAILDLRKKVEGVVLTVKKLDEDIEGYSNRVFNEWKIGKKDTDSGFLLVISMEPRKLRLEIGRGNEGKIPDITAKDILDDTMKPYLAKKEFYKAFDAGIQEIIRRIEQND